MKRTAILLILLLVQFTSRAQVSRDSCSLEISLLTCAPGEDLYSIFGHTAIRVRDTTRGMDVVYNYGTFDDTDPLFYVHFTRGIMNYSLAAETMDNFMAEYQFEHRGVKEQILNLNCTEKNRLYQALRNNTLEENRFYQYHFHTDNCTTRAAKIIQFNTDSSLVFKNILTTPGPSFRDMIHEYLNQGKQYWSAFGIDMLLGANLDRKPSNTEAIYFLPDYLYRGIDGAEAGKKPVVSSRNTVIEFPESDKPSALLTPMVLFTGILLISIVLFLLRARPGFAAANRIFDIVFFTVLGLTGLLMAAVWLGRVDDVCRNNINILWALPTHLVAVFLMRRQKAWLKYYFGITALLALLLCIGFPWWYQRMNIAVLPILTTIILRSGWLFLKKKNAEIGPVSR